jgi:hypothetical protein
MKSADKITDVIHRLSIRYGFDPKDAIDFISDPMPITEIMEITNSLDHVKNVGRKWVKSKFMNVPITITEPGSITFLINGKTPSIQSISIKLGRLGEALSKEMIKSNPNLELLQCGVQVIDKKLKKKDIDLIWLDKQSKKIYVREAKGNIELDTEKLPATFKKITEDLMPFVKDKYPDYEIDVGILNWSVYAREEHKKCLSHIKTCEKNGVNVNHWGDFCKIVQFEWLKDDYYKYMLDLGKMINSF